MQALPSWLVRALGRFVPVVREAAEMLYEFEEPHVVDDSRFTQTFGGQATPLREAIRATVAWYRRSSGAKGTT
jgi:hypothetical protein